MLEQIREKAPRWLVSTILVLLVVPFALWGVNSYVQPSGQVSAARVGETNISTDDLQRALRQEGLRLRQSLGDAYTPELLDNPGTRRTVLERLINRELLAQDAAQRRLQVADDALANLIQNTPEFAGASGFDKAIYEARLRQQNLTPATFEADLRQSLALQQIETGISRTAFMSAAELDRLAALWFERRDLGVATLAWEKFRPQSAPDAGQLQAYYDAHKSEFSTDEQATVAYVELSLDQMAGELAIDEAMLQKRYQEVKSELGTAEQRRVRHILIRVPPDAAPEAVEQARLKAVDIRSKLTAGADFSVLAKAESGDPGSADQGGDLGFISRGTMTEAFDEAAFSLAQNTPSEPVRTPFGFHLIEVTQIKPGSAPALDEVRDTLRQRVQRELAEERFFAAAETLRTQTFEHPDTLEPAAKALGLSIKQIGPFKRAEGEGIAANPEFVRHAFSNEVVGGENSEVFELGNGHFAVLRMLEHTPATVRPLDEVKDAVADRLLREQGIAAAEAAGQEVLKKLRDGTPVEQALSAHGASFKKLPDVGREGADGLPPALLKRAFAVPFSEGKPGYAGLALDSGDYAIVTVTGRRTGPAASNTEAREALREQLIAIRADQALTEHLTALREQHAVRIVDSQP